MKEKNTQARPAARVAFTDGKAPAPATMAVDAAPRAGDALSRSAQSAVSRLFAPAPPAAVYVYHDENKPEEG